MTSSSPEASESFVHTDGLYYSPVVSKHVIKVMQESGKR
jgi:hypothetical protein